jgi:hypothetical protein
LFERIPRLPSRRLFQFKSRAEFMLEVPACPIIADVPPSAARKVGLDHGLDERATILVLYERLIKETSCQSQGNFIHVLAPVSGRDTTASR